MDAITEFKIFLMEKNNEYADYFMSNEGETDNINRCFAIRNNNDLIYIKSSKLRQDIKEEVVGKYKLLLGDKGYYAETD